MDNIQRFISENWSKVLGGFLGFLVAMVILLFGFWRTLFIVVLVLIGIYLGGKLEHSEYFRGAISRFWNNRHRF